MKLVRLIKLLRLLKMARVIKLKRFLAAYWSHFHITYQSQAILKFIIFIVSCAHWTACLIRILSERRRGRGDHDDKMAPDTWLDKHGLYNQGMWAEYLAAMVWAIQALNGSAFVYTVEEHLGALVVLFVGCVVIAFMIGEIANVLTSMDPTGNQYKMTMDLLGTYMNERQFGKDLKRKLREYFAQCEQLFREKYYQDMLSSLTPQFREVVAVENIGRWVKRLRVVQNSVLRASGLEAGMLVAVYPADEDGDRANQSNGPPDGAAADEPQPLRGGWVVRINKVEGTVDVAYTEEAPLPGETFSRNALEAHIDAERVTMPRFTAKGQLWHRTMAAHRGLIAQLSLILEPTVYMADEPIAAEGSEADTMCLVISGAVIKQGAVRPMQWPKTHLISDDHFGCVGEDMMHALVTSSKLTRHYSVRAASKCNMYTMVADKFLQKVEMVQFKDLRHHMRQHVAWSLLRDTVCHRNDLVRAWVDQSQTAGDTGAAEALASSLEKAVADAREGLRKGVDAGGKRKLRRALWTAAELLRDLDTAPDRGDDAARDAGLLPPPRASLIRDIMKANALKRSSSLYARARGAPAAPPDAAAEGVELPPDRPAPPSPSGDKRTLGAG